MDHSLTMKIDMKCIGQSILHSNRQITRFITTTFDWSIESAQAVQAVRYLRLHLKHMNGFSVIVYSLETTHIAASLTIEVADHAIIKTLVQKFETCPRSSR
jgi:hypothetical protein